MLKIQRHEKILSELKKKKSVKVADLVKTLEVTEMTIRRDLKELEESGKLVRIHGGATSLVLNNTLLQQELSHNEKRDIHFSSKKIISKKVAQIIKNNDTIFIGAGTTLENVYDYLTIDRARIVTNSIHIFNRFRNDERFELVLVGGTYRPISGAFIGTLANDFIDKIKVQKAFIGVNGIFEGGAYNANEYEGITNKHILDSAIEKYIVADHSKFDRQDFYCFYNISDVQGIISDKTDSKLQK